MVDQIADFVQKNGGGTKFGKMGFLVHAMTTELLEELREADPEMMGNYLVMMGGVLKWCGTGDPSDLPDELHSYMKPPAQALPAGTATE